ncbi:MAG: helix-turn-helix transcriptional regulator [Bacteroidota bacterium]
MRHLEYDLKLALIIKSIRKQKLMKQYILAKALNMQQATYSRVEKGTIAITPGQLHIIAHELGTTSSRILLQMEQ